MEKFGKENYDFLQLNQIHKCKGDFLSYLSPIFDASIFKKLRKYGDLLDTELSSYLAYSITKTKKIFGYNIDEFLSFLDTKDIADSISVLRMLSSIMKFDDIYSTTFDKEALFNALVQAIENGIDTRTVVSVLKIKNETGKDFSFLFENKKNANKSTTDFLNEYNTFVTPKRLEKLLEENTISHIQLLCKEIKKYDYNKNILEYTNQLQYFKVINYILENKFDINYFENYSDNSKRLLLNLFDYDKECFDYFYKNKFKEDFLFTLSTVGYDIEMANFLYNKKCSSKLKNLLPHFIKRCNAKKEDIDYLIKNEKSYTENDLELFNEYAQTIFFEIDFERINFKKFIDVSFSTIQRKTILEIFKNEKIDITFVCDDKFSPEQMKVIADAIKHHKNYKFVLDPSIPASKMEEEIFYKNAENLNKFKKSGNLKEDKNTFYENFLNIYYQIFDDDTTDFCKMEIIEQTLYYNQKHEYQFDIEKNIKLSKFFVGEAINEFPSFLALGKEAEKFYKIDNKSEFFKAFCPNKIKYQFTKV